MSARPVLAAAVTFALAVMGGISARSAERHGLSTFGDLKYGADFAHFDYVNPDAPKGGRIALVGTSGTLTFDSFNNFILKGDKAEGLDLIYDSLLTRALDEPDAAYGLVAKSVDLAADRSAVTFTLRPEAKFSDGSPVTAEDVCFSFDALKTKGGPPYPQVLRDVQSCTAAPGKVSYTFSGALVRDLPLFVGQLPILSKAYYQKVPFEETSLDRPVTSGPYRIGPFKQGTFVTYERRADYWAADLPVNRGRFNFDQVRFDYFRDRTAGLENLKSGEYDYREEFTSRDWATAYDIPQVRDGRILKRTVPDALPSGTQGFFFNMRRAKFSDQRVRQALELAFDFEWSNAKLFYGLYTRTQSYFENSPMKATGAPDAGELKLLEPLRDKLPAEVFGPVHVPPVSDASGTDRRLLSQAGQLLTAAGWQLQNGRRVKNGEPLTIEFLNNESAFERILGPYISNLKALGIAAEIRTIDPAQYERRVKSFDFDVITTHFIMSLTPGVELRSYFGTEAARQEGSRNLAGIEDPAVDALVDAVVGAKSRDDLNTATRALDRVLRAGYYWVPQWYKAEHNLAHWDKFSWPATKPTYDIGLDTWWYDPAKAQKLTRN